VRAAAHRETLDGNSKFEMASSTKNRSFWNSTSDAYQGTHGATLAERAMAWGVWRVPESELGILGRVDGRAVLELGCGAAQWTVALSRVGARAVGLDLSERQLTHARTLSRSVDRRIPLVQGSAEHLPFRSEIFDVVFCDHGATVFAPLPRPRSQKRPEY
jgi:ubiquinone/menaquinone biosynthesis C-methylase UbiE